VSAIRECWAGNERAQSHRVATPTRSHHKASRLAPARRFAGTNFLRRRARSMVGRTLRRCALPRRTRPMSSAASSCPLSRAAQLSVRNPNGCGQREDGVSASSLAGACNIARRTARFLRHNLMREVPRRRSSMWQSLSAGGVKDLDREGASRIGPAAGAAGPIRVALWFAL
jgi:hypothetical protein